MINHYPVVIVGGGQAGLSMSYCLKERGLDHSLETLVETCDRLINIGVYPFVIPFVPISGTPLANHSAPTTEFMFAVYEQVGAMLRRSQRTSKQDARNVALVHHFLFLNNHDHSKLRYVQFYLFRA